MSDQSIGGFAANFAFNLHGVALVEGAVKAVERLNAAVARREKVHEALTEIYGDKNKAAALIGVSADEGALAAQRAEKKAGVLERVFHAMSIAQMAYAAAANIAARVTNFFTATLDQAGHAVDLSQRLGISASQVQKFGYAASQSGADVDTFTQGLTGLSNKLDAAKKGSKDAAASLRAVGLGGAGDLPLDQSLGKIADKFASMPDGAKKSALAVDLFGKAGVKLIPMLNEGSAGIDELGAEAERLGIVIDDKAAAAMEGMGDEADKLKLTLGGIRNSVVAALLPALASLIRYTQAWVTEHREGIVRVVTVGMRVLIGVLKAASVAVSGVVTVMSYLADHSDLLIAVITGLGTAIYLLVASFIALKIEAALAWLAAVGPAVLSAAAIGVAVAAIVLLLLKFRSIGASVLNGIGKAADWVGQRFKDLWHGLRAVFSTIRDFFVTIFDGVKNAVIAAIDWIKARLEDAAKLAKRVARGAVSWIPGIGGALADAIADDPDAAPAAPTSPTVPASSFGPPAGGKSVSMTNSISVSSPNANPAQVADLVVEKLNGLLREADAAIA